VDAQQFAEFKRGLLLDAAFDDVQQIGAAVWQASDYGEEAAKWGERALRELFAEGLIYFFLAEGKVNASASDPRLRFTPAEVDSLLRSHGWRTAPYAAEFPDVWFGATPEGERAAARAE
jgi:hypothetical protein